MKAAVIGIMILFAGAAGFMVVIDHRIYMAIIALVFAAGVIGVLREKLPGYCVALLPIILPLLILLRKLIRRVIFFIREGGLERRDGQGSPLAFLLGLFIELFGLALVCGFGAWIIERIVKLWRRRTGRPIESPAAVNKGRGGELPVPGE
ncbi:MAG: hypothetical protein P9M08_02865 [Candidatus Erginobacter occultus]|nr:hypothetical protein [Candidatus Erginobacter occultus]